MLNTKQIIAVISLLGFLHVNPKHFLVELDKEKTDVSKHQPGVNESMQIIFDDKDAISTFDDELYDEDAISTFDDEVYDEDAISTFDDQVYEEEGKFKKRYINVIQLQQD